MSFAGIVVCAATFLFIRMFHPHCHQDGVLFRNSLLVGIPVGWYRMHRCVVVHFGAATLNVVRSRCLLLLLVDSRTRPAAQTGGESMAPEESKMKIIK